MARRELETFEASANTTAESDLLVDLQPVPEPTDVAAEWSTRTPAASQLNLGKRRVAVARARNATRVEPYSKSLPLPNAIPWPTIVPSVSAIANQPRSTTERREAQSTL